MKDIGFTQEGNRLIEMNRAEYGEFVFLREAVEGKTGVWGDVPNRGGSFMEEFDFKNTFEVIRAYYENKFFINRFRELLDKIENSTNESVGV